MVARISTVSFLGIDIKEIDVQVQISPGLPAFNIVGLADKAVAESRERVRASFAALGLAWPSSRITVNLAPADILKEGSHYDLPMALGILMELKVLPKDVGVEYLALGELSLDGQIAPVSGVLPAAFHANVLDKGVICPRDNGAEATWAGGHDIVAARNLADILNHFNNDQPVPAPEEAEKIAPRKNAPDMADIKGQEMAKRALEIAATGQHNLLMIGPPGVGKSMLASRLPTILPPLSSEEALEISMIYSLNGGLENGQLITERPYRAPHHSASLPSLIGGGHKAKPGEVSLAHGGVLFLDELPEFQRATLETLRQPIESGKASISRANAHVTYPARFQLIAAMNPCKCGFFTIPEKACNKAPRCAQDYQNKLSGPLLDRIDLFVHLQPMAVHRLDKMPKGESSQDVRHRVLKGHGVQQERFADKPANERFNAFLDSPEIAEYCKLEPLSQQMLDKFSQQQSLSARGYYRLLKVARTIADMAESNTIQKAHLAEAILYRSQDLKV